MREDKKKNGAGEEQPVNKKSQYQSPNGGKTYDSRDDFSTISKRVKKARGKLELLPQEWAMFYDRIGEIKKEGHYVPRMKNGDLIPIEADKSNVLVIAKGTYEHPKANRAWRFADQNELYTFIERWRHFND